MLVCQVRTDAVAEIDVLLLRLNSDTGANYDRENITGNFTTISSGGSRAQTSMAIGAIEAASSRASNFGPIDINIFGYSRTDAEKWAFSRGAAFGNVSADLDLFIQLLANRWRNPTAISSITLLPNTGPNFVSGSRFGLYGVG